jgi:hypothetical protein
MTDDTHVPQVPGEHELRSELHDTREPLVAGHNDELQLVALSQ